MCGGGGDTTLQTEQAKQAEEARKKELQRQFRLKRGREGIDAAYDGTPTYGTEDRAFKMADWANAPTAANVFQLGNAFPLTGAPTFDLRDGELDPVSGLPKGYSFGFGANVDPNTGLPIDNYLYRIKDAGGQTVFGADTLDNFKAGQFTYQGDKVSSRTGGIPGTFYDSFKQANLDYYLPELDKQFQDNLDQVQFALARAGTLRSSIAGDMVAKVNSDYALQDANLRSKADTAVGDLRDRVQKERQLAYSQLYSTEDPDVAANQALSQVNNVKLNQPDFDPIGELFKPIAAGIGGALQSYYDPWRRIGPPPTGGTGSGRKY